MRENKQKNKLIGTKKKKLQITTKEFIEVVRGKSGEVGQISRASGLEVRRL